MKRDTLLLSMWLSCNLVSFAFGSQAAAQTPKTDTTTQKQTPSSTTYRVGLKSISIPPPAGLFETGSDYRVLFEHDAPDSNRLVAAFLPADEIAMLPAGPEGGRTRYCFVETLRQAEFVDVDEPTFKQATDATAKQYGSGPDSPAVDVKAFQDELNHNLKAEGRSVDVSLDKPVMLGTLFSKPNAAGFGMLMDVGTGGKTVKVIVGTGLLRIHNRLLYTAVFAQYTGDDSAAWVRATSEQWADAILKANPN